jgi:uncharacterized protein involved in response to NO
MKRIEPYRLFFPIGWLLGLAGGLIWIPWLLKMTEEYPGLHHPDIMIGGFLMTYSLGFLTTAIPHFTSTQMMSLKEKVCAFFILGILIFSFFLQIKALTHLTEFFLILFLLYFAGRRFLGRSNNPPPTFIFIGIGLFLGAIGSMLLMLLDLGFIEQNFLVIAKSTFYTGFMLSLIIGIGSRLIPALMGHQPVHPPVRLPNENSFWGLISWDIKFLAFTFVLSFLFDLSDTYGFVGHILRLILIFFVAIKYWKLYMLPRNKGFMYILLWLSSWSMVVGQFMLAFFPSLQLQSIHLIYVSGFGLLTIMISTRVTLAHGGFPLFPEKNSLAILFSGIFILAAALLRFIGPLAKGQYENMLLFSSISWSLALIIWLTRFGAHWPKADSVH